MFIILLIIVVGIIIVFEVPRLLALNAKKELISFSFLLLIGVGYSLGYLLDMQMPNPTTIVEFIFKLPSEALQRLFKN